MAERRFPRAQVIVVAGVAGAGKSTIGGKLALRLGARFIDADSLHGPQSIEKMRAGIPLTDADRVPWLEALAQQIREALGRGERLVLACSALQRRYRRRLDPEQDDRILWVFLQGPRDLLAERLEHRANHFMNPALLDDQLATFEPPQAGENAITLGPDASPDATVDRILAA